MRILRSKLISKNLTAKLTLPDKDLIPCACHYDEDTVLTKNGELFQVIKIVGFYCETVGAEKVSLRETIRQAVLQNVKSEKISFCFHTIRTKKNLDLDDDYETTFSKDLHSSWARKNYWHDKYVNEVYVTIIHESLPISIKNPKDFLASLSFKHQRKVHDEYLEQAHSELKQTVDGVLSTLQQYGANRLTITESKKGFISEILQFFGKIIHLSEQELPLPLIDISQFLATHKMAFGNNTIEVMGERGKHFAAILSLKEYMDLPAVVMDQFLQLPIEFIVTQTVNFVESRKVIKQFDYQNYILSVSRNPKFGQISGISEIMSVNPASATECCESQFTIMILAETLAELQEDIQRSVNALTKMGLQVIREDIFMEKCFWSQLPANFSFFSRKKYLKTDKIAGFASLHNFPAGNRTNNHWGDAITIFRTAALGTPYFFNFHRQDNGHTILIGPQESGRTALMNFLVSEASRILTKLILIDQYGTAEVLLKAMNGTYLTAGATAKESGTEALHLNILTLDPAHDKDRSCLKQWFSAFYKAYVGNRPEEIVTEKVNFILEIITSLSASERHLRLLLEKLEMRGFDTDFCQALRQLLETEPFSSLFGGEIDHFATFSGKILGINCESIANNNALLTLFVPYVLYRIQNLMNGTPSMVVLDDAWHLLERMPDAVSIKEWLDSLKRQNAVALLASEKAEFLAEKPLTATIVSQTATQIYLPNADPSDAYKQRFGLTEEEYALLTSMKIINKHFLLKHGEDAIVAELNLSGINEMLAILNGDQEVRKVLKILLQENGDNPEIWLPLLYERYKYVA